MKLSLVYIALIFSTSLHGQVLTSNESSDREPMILERTPLQILQDPYLDLSGIAVDPVRDEIVLVTGQRAAQVLIYDRTADTPEGVDVHPPKRVLKGPKTKIGAPGVYVDPKSGEIYSVDTTHGMYAGSGNRIVMFSHGKEGNIPPDRELEVPHRGFAIDADEAAGELYVTIQHPPAVVVYSKDAKHNEAPLRILEGGLTELTDVHGIALDTKNKLIYTANRGSWSALNEEREWSGTPINRDGDNRTWDIPTRIEAHMVPGSGKFKPASITVYPQDASGNVAPIRTISGPNTKLGWPAFIALDEERQELYVANAWPHSILVFDANDQGNASPIRVINGKNTGLDNPYGIAIDTKNDEIVVANYGNHTAMVFPRTGDGDIAPLRTIRLAPKGFQVPIYQHLSAVEYDSKRDEILVQSCIAQPQMVAFSKGAKNGDPLARILAGQDTRQGRALHDMRYNPVHDEIVFANPNAQALLTFAGGARGGATPLRVIQGPKTGLIKSDYIEVDPVHDELYAPDMDKILVFPRTAEGDVAPIRVLQGPATGLSGKNGRFMAVDPEHNLLVVPGRDRLLIFDRTASGNTSPKAVIHNKHLDGILHVRVYPPKGLIVVSMGGKSNGIGQDEMTGIGVWSIHDNGDVPPLMLLRDPYGSVAGRKIALNPDDKEIIVGGGITVRRYAFPELF